MVIGDAIHDVENTFETVNTYGGDTTKRTDTNAPAAHDTSTGFGDVDITEHEDVEAYKITRDRDAFNADVNGSVDVAGSVDVYLSRNDSSQYVDLLDVALLMSAPGVVVGSVGVDNGASTTGDAPEPATTKDYVLGPLLLLTRQKSFLYLQSMIWPAYRPFLTKLS